MRGYTYDVWARYKALMFDTGEVGVPPVLSFFPSYPCVAISLYEQHCTHPSFPQLLAESQEHAVHPTENSILVNALFFFLLK